MTDYEALREVVADLEVKTRQQHEAIKVLRAALENIVQRKGSEAYNHDVANAALAATEALT
jgi:hypothetical protein